MSLDKAIKHGKEKRQEYRGSASFSQSCRDNTCPYCAARLKYKAKKRQPVVPELTGKQWSAMRTVIHEYAEKFRAADTYEMASAYMDAAPEAVYQVLLKAGKGTDRG